MTEPRLRDYRFGQITVDGRTYQKDILVYDHGVIPNWWRRQGHSLVPDDLTEVMAKEPRTLVVGCGAYGALVVPESTKAWLEEQGVELIALPTAKACSAYNDRQCEGGVVAALHLTC
jgi:hypothetical protein